MGHLLYQLGFVGKKAMHKFEQDSRKAGKGSFAYAWVLDETEEERQEIVSFSLLALILDWHSTAPVFDFNSSMNACLFCICLTRMFAAGSSRTILETAGV